MLSSYTKKDIVKIVGEIDHDKLHTYLVQAGWEQTTTIRNIASIWHRPEIEMRRDAEVVLPLVAELQDYTYRIFDVMQGLSSFEGKSIIEFARTVSSFFADCISVRVIHADVSDGTIPIDDGVILNQRARDLLTSAALSTHAKRRSFSGARPPETNAYIETLRLGQTSVGSYVVNVIAPISPPKVQQSLMPVSSLARVVTDTLIASLSALETASEAYLANNDVRVFDSTVELGVSSNLCDALLGLSGENHKREFEIQVSPSQIDPVKATKLKFMFTESKIVSIAKASEYFKDNYVLEGAVIQGFVKRLDRPKSDENGTVVVEAKVLGIDKHVTIELASADYLEAVGAHRAKDPVQCRGDIHVTTRTAKLLSPSGFIVMGSKDFFD